jgi:hypothetical protein
MLASIEAKQFQAWTLAGLMMLDVPETDQKNLENRAEAARTAFRRGKNVGEVENILVYVQPTWRDEAAVACVICNTTDRKVRDGNINNALIKIRKHTSAKMAFIIARSLDETEGP